MNMMIRKLFGVKKPVITMVHLLATPGTPCYDSSQGIEGILKWVCENIQILIDGGVKGIFFNNEDDRPSSFHAGFDSVAVMTRVGNELRPLEIPFGVDFLRNPPGSKPAASSVRV